MKPVYIVVAMAVVGAQRYVSVVGPDSGSGAAVFGADLLCECLADCDFSGLERVHGDAGWGAAIAAVAPDSLYAVPIFYGGLSPEVYGAAPGGADGRGDRVWGFCGGGGCDRGFGGRSPRASKPPVVISRAQ